MRIIARCPDCGKKVAFNESLAGRMVKCPACAHTFKTPAAPDPEQAETLAEETDPQPAPATPSRGVRAGQRERTRELPEEDEAEDTTRGRSPAKGVSVLGIISLVLGIVGLLISLIPCVGMIGLPVAGLGLVLGIVGLMISLSGKRSGVGFPIAGSAVSLVGLVIAGAWLGLASVLAHKGHQQLTQLQNELQKEADEDRQIRNGPGIPVTAMELHRQYARRCSTSAIGLTTKSSKSRGPYHGSRAGRLASPPWS